MQRHFQDQTGRYGDQIVLNLVNTKGYEAPMAQEFWNYIQAIAYPNLRYSAYSSLVINPSYFPFDFHLECKNMKFERVSVLVSRLEQQDLLRKQGYFSYDFQKNQVLSSQTGVIRTNCMDCLDRTNVVQTEFARQSLLKQLDAFNLSGQAVLKKSSPFEIMFRNSNSAQPTP